MIDVTSTRVIGGVEYGFVFGGRKPTSEAVAMRIRASGGLARVVKIGGKHAEDVAWVVYANDRGKPTARRMIETLMQAAA